MKGWTLLGVVLAVVGVVVFMNGLNNRLAKKTPSSTEKQGQIPAANPKLSAEDSSAIFSRPMTPADSKPLVEHVLPEIDELTTPAKEVNVGSKPEVKFQNNPPRNKISAPKPDESHANFSDPVFSNDPDARKKNLVKLLRVANWSTEELEQLVNYLEDPRATFRSEILVRNSTFTETADIYLHNLTPESIARSVQFLHDNQMALESAHRSEGVPLEIMVAILKVETNLGEWRGKESVFNVYWSLSLGDHTTVQRDLLTDDPAKVVEMKARMIKRAKWARGQLRDLLFVAKHGGENPVGILGSFAGAFGLPQFIPSSYRSFGQDGNGDGIIDLDGVPDATRSIGYYLKENGWPNKPDRARMRKSILSYNHSVHYADCVLSLADSLSMRLNGALIAN